MKQKRLIDLFLGIFALIILIGIFYAIFWSFNDIGNRYDICEDNGGEITSGLTNGCLINDTLHKMTRTKKGWIILNDVLCTEKENKQ